MTEDPAMLLQKLSACRINFDPQAEHAYGTAKPEKVAFVPVELLEQLQDYLKAAQ
ncbi:MAG: hypothetical protein JWM96_503 [Alphaproteobacteria bacterium]|nr:hypothetical protein [Alphaproteobacteria bacterium]